MNTIKGKAIAITAGYLDDMHAKTTHGLIRGSERFELVGIIDEKFAGQHVKQFVDDAHQEIPIFENIASYLASDAPKASYCIVGIATSGGILPANIRKIIMIAIKNGLSIINGLHEYLSDFTDLVRAAEYHDVQLIDIRKPRSVKELKFWSGDIVQIKTPRIAVLGTDCAVGKRTTCRLLWETCNENGIKAEMLYTGQTGWMQGYKHGFIFDATLNDFISGEIERMIIDADTTENPDVILIEGQSSLRNPSGPCGSELLVSGGVKYVILQHVPFRDGYDAAPEIPIKSIETEIQLIRLYGAEVIAITLNGEGKNTDDALINYAKTLKAKINLPIICPLEEGITGLLKIVKSTL